MSREIIGKTKDGKDIISTTIVGKNGLKVTAINLGCCITNIWTKDKNGNDVDVVLGFENVNDYEGNTVYFGAAVVPCGNRIGEAKYTLNGVEYICDKNDGNNNLHSGFDTLAFKVWDIIAEADDQVVYGIHKEDGVCGFPGNSDYTVTYAVLEDNTLEIRYSALSDKDTIFNPTNHSYFNMNGHDSGDILDQFGWVNADGFTYTDSESIPHGEIRAVKGTPLEYSTPKKFAEGMDDISFDQIKWAGGVDHNFALNKVNNGEPIASMYSDKTGIYMEVFTDLPGIQIYTANFVTEAHIGKGEHPYGKRTGCCFETQYFPNAINIPEFPQPVIKAGVKAETVTSYRFSVK